MADKKVDAQDDQPEDLDSDEANRLRAEIMVEVMGEDALDAVNQEE